jgi:hypothetical protein
MALATDLMPSKTPSPSIWAFLSALFRLLLSRVCSLFFAFLSSSALLAISAALAASSASLAAFSAANLASSASLANLSSYFIIIIIFINKNKFNFKYYNSNFFFSVL